MFNTKLFFEIGYIKKQEIRRYYLTNNCLTTILTILKQKLTIIIL